jgi:hypothetical protein
LGKVKSISAIARRMPVLLTCEADERVWPEPKAGARRAIERLFAKRTRQNPRSRPITQPSVKTKISLGRGEQAFTADAETIYHARR